MKEYISKHTIVQIGLTLDGYVCSEVIVDDPYELLSVIDTTIFYISEIRFWDRTLIDDGSSIGYGGVRDPRDPSLYFFAETDLWKEFSELTQKREYCDYILAIKEQYKQYDLYPAFDIMIKNTGDSSKPLRKSDFE